MTPLPLLRRFLKMRLGPQLMLSGFALMLVLPAAGTFVKAVPGIVFPQPPQSAFDLPEARTQLAELRVAAPAPMSGYDRVPKFGRWIDADHNGCDTREDLLQVTGHGVDVGEGCRIAAGAWNDPYAGKLLSGPDMVEVDHLVPLAEAWRSGAGNWTQVRRIAFANDPLNLLAVDASLNAAKGDRDPARWMPPDTSTHGVYAARYIAVKHKYGLTLDAAEQRKLAALVGAPT